MGYLENESTILSKRVIVSQTLQTELQKTTGMGKIKELSPYTITLESEDIALNLHLKQQSKTNPKF